MKRKRQINARKKRRISTNRTERELKKIRYEERKIREEEKSINSTEKRILREEKRIEEIEKRVLEEEHKILVSIGNLRIKRGHVMDFFKIVGGALVGTSFGTGLISKTDLARELPLVNVIQIFIISMIIGAALIYKAEKPKLNNEGRSPFSFVAKRMIYIWVIAIAVGGISGILLITEPVSNEVFIKVLLLGSYPAMAGAIGFNFV